MATIESVLILTFLALIFIAGVGVALVGCVLDRAIDPDDAPRWIIRFPTERRRP